MNTESRPSPCIRNCCLDEQDICLGCFRSIEEIMRWAESDNTERDQIMEKAGQRQKLSNSQGEVQNCFSQVAK